MMVGVTSAPSSLLSCQEPLVFPSWLALTPGATFSCFYPSEKGGVTEHTTYLGSPCISYANHCISRRARVQ